MLDTQHIDTQEGETEDMDTLETIDMTDKNVCELEVLNRLLCSDLNMHHIISFDHLIYYHIPSILETYGTFCTMINNKRYRFSVRDIHTTPPESSTDNCYKYGLNYLFCINGTLILEEELQMDNDKETVRWSVCKQITCRLMYLPLMTGRSILSRELDIDHEEYTGLLICKGKCRTVPPTKTLMHNEPFFFRKGSVFRVQIRSVHFDKVFRSTSTLEVLVDTTTTIILCKLPFQPTPIPIDVIFTALGANMTDIVMVIRRIAGSLRDVDTFRQYETMLIETRPNVHTRDDAYMFISKLYGKNIRSTGKNVINNELFPHMNDQNLDITIIDMNKCHYLCSILISLILFKHGKINETDRDCYSVSQITSTANHLGSLVRLLFIAHIRTCGKLLRRSIMNTAVVEDIDLENVYGEHRLSHRILSAVSSGIWSGIRKGVSMSLGTNNHDAIEGQLRRISSSLTMTDGSHTNPRKVSSDQYGFICAASSPDGETTGLVYELGLTATLSPPVSSFGFVISVVYAACADLLYSIHDHGAYDVDGNSYTIIDTLGRVSYGTNRVNDVITRIRTLRRSCSISPFVFIHVHHNRHILRLVEQEGILCRPLWIVREGICMSDTIDGDRRIPSLPFLLATGRIEYVSPYEQMTDCMIATSRQYINPTTTHMELTQASLLGLIASSVPFVTGQQGPRLAYFTSQKRQIITATPKKTRGSITTTQTWYSFRPLLETKTNTMMYDKYRFYRYIPVVLAFMCMPYNQEDAIVIKKSTIERGAFNATTTRIYVSETCTNSSITNERFEKPTNVINKKQHSYKHIKEDGLPGIGQYIPGGSVVIGKTRCFKRTPIHLTNKQQPVNRRDISTVSRHDESGTVTMSKCRKLHNGKRVEVALSTSRDTIVGDKFTSQYAQKGVIGQVCPDVDMPFSMRTGIAPDIIVSPLSMTSRMTMSSMLETLVGKCVCLEGDTVLGIDDQLYDNVQEKHKRLDNMKKILIKHGFRGDGKERFIDGRTGEKIETHLFTGMVDYSRLMHLASKKIHARSIGPRDPLTRQPRDGRRFGGGLRIGEMETSALAAHGCTRILQERFRELSDGFEIYICTVCGIPCDYVNTDIEYQFCKSCQDTESIRRILIPFTFMVLTMELLAMGVEVRYILKETDIVFEYPMV